jgi:hypothetical protein
VRRELDAMDALYAAGVAEEEQLLEPRKPRQHRQRKQKASIAIQ